MNREGIHDPPSQLETRSIRVRRELGLRPSQRRRLGFSRASAWRSGRSRCISSSPRSAMNPAASPVRRRDLNYSAERLMAVWPGRFPTIAAARACAGRPKALASLVYASRMGNGGPESGDGLALSGAPSTLSRITGRANYAALLPPPAGLDLLAEPERAAQLDGALLVACALLADERPPCTERHGRFRCCRPADQWRRHRHGGASRLAGEGAPGDRGLGVHLPLLHPAPRVLHEAGGDAHPTGRRGRAASRSAPPDA